MRLWLLMILVVLCIVAGMLIPVPKLIYQEIFVPAEATAPPISNIGFADRQLDLGSAPTPAPTPEPVPTPEPLYGQTLLHDPALQSGVVDWYAQPAPLRLDIDTLAWAQAEGAPPEPQVLPSASAVEGTILSVLPLENGFAAAGQDGGAPFLRFYAQDGSLEHTYDASAMGAEGKLLPMGDPNCAYVLAEDGSPIVINSQDGSQYTATSGDRPVWLFSENGALLVQRGQDYILIATASGAEASYHIEGQ